MFLWLALISLALFRGPPLVRSHVEGERVSASVYHYNNDSLEVEEVNATEVDLVLQCESQIGPTEWILDDDITNITAPVFHLPCSRIEENRRWHPVEGHKNLSWINLYACENVESALMLGCRSVRNHSDNVLVKLDPNATTGLLYVTKQRGAWVDFDEPKLSNTSTCVRFTVAQIGNDTYWRCNGPDGVVGDFRIRYCDSSSDCANTQRKWKLVPVCVEIITNRTHIKSLGDEGWTWMQTEMVAKYPAGVAICELNNNGEHRGAAVEFFFAGPDKSTLHFSLSEISMNDLIWFDPMPNSDTFYTEDLQFETRCKVSDHGLAPYPRLIVKFNGSIQQGAEMGEGYQYDRTDTTHTTNVSIGFQDDGRGPGMYEIECSALVWNTSEWASKKIEFEVRAVVAPHFDADNEQVMVRQGEQNARVQCDVRGDPAPNITWDHGDVPGIRVEGRDLVFATNNHLSVQWINGIIVSCNAVNKYGQSATKGFKILIATEETPTSGASNSSSTWTAIGISLLVISLLALVLGLGYLTFRFVKFGRTVAHVLSDEEVKEFQEGKPTFPAIGDGDEEGQLVVDCLSYNSEFEVARENISIDFNTELGSGQYGVVYMGTIKQQQQTVQVAVKTVRPNVPIEYFKALLSELKILAYIGEHENIARLVGAYTSNIKNRELYVGVEFCKTSLESHLRKNAPTFTTDIRQTEEGSVYGNVDRAITMLDLIRWSREIAAGMEYLSEKRIVHGDLAARNVLLSFDLHAKICDFGLARQLVDYTYIKTTKCNLPWKWMAIESLRQMHFSAMSDVWSYGVTCWEIFSLGDVPYPCMAWSWEFVNGLVAGNRLTKPRHANPEIFTMLLQCWFERKERRPLFSELVRFFKEQERKIVRADAYVGPDEFN